MPRRFELDTQACRSCGAPHPPSELDPHRWCRDCRARLARRVNVGQHAVALLVTLPFLVWILLEGTGRYFPLWAWLLPLTAAYYLGLRIGRELLKGVLRARALRRDAHPRPSEADRTTEP